MQEPFPQTANLITFEHKQMEEAVFFLINGKHVPHELLCQLTDEQWQEVQRQFLVWYMTRILYFLRNGRMYPDTQVRYLLTDEDRAELECILEVEQCYMGLAILTLDTAIVHFQDLADGAYQARQRYSSGSAVYTALAETQSSAREMKESLWRCLGYNPSDTLRMIKGEISWRKKILAQPCVFTGPLQGLVERDRAARKVYEKYLEVLRKVQRYLNQAQETDPKAFQPDPECL